MTCQEAYRTYLLQLQQDIQMFNQIPAEKWSPDDQSDFLRLQHLLEQEQVCSVDSRLYGYLQGGLIPFRSGDIVKSAVDSSITGVFDHYMSIRKSGNFGYIKPAVGPVILVAAEHLRLVAPKEWME